MRMSAKLYSMVRVVLITLPATAQLTRGFISGVVQDSAGAVIGDVKITIANKATGIKSETRTNGVGVYRFVAVESGVYDIEFSQTGFETKRIANVEVTATKEVTLDESLGVAATSTTVEVSDTPPGVDLNKSSASIERKLDQSFVANVAITVATRDVNQLALLAPTANRAPGSTSIAANGQRARNNNFLLDGVDTNDLSVTLSSDRVIQEAVAEFQTQVQSYSAEFGRNSGAQIQVITRSGSNTWHGEAWDYYRGNWMEPVNLLNKRAGLTKTPRYVHNQSGGAIGGHIIKNRTFL